MRHVDSMLHPRNNIVFDISRSNRTKKGSELSQVIALKEMDSCKDDGKSKPIKIRDFDETLLKLHADGNALLNLEYQELDKLSPLYPMDVGSDLDHRADNRWTNIVPFDHSRVKLFAREGSGQHDYINANYIAGMDSSREYIATQGPLTKTIPEFWRMVWEQKSSAIVMLSEFEAIDKRTQMMREKVARYYPDEEESNSYQYDQIMVSRTGKLDTKDWEIRTLKLTHLTERKNRFVKHFFFKYWSDHEANINPVDLIDFVRVVRAETSAQPTSPLIVHCSAGVGRTGTYIAVDYFNKYIQSLKLKLEKTDKRVQENWTVDIFGRVLNMRDKRRFMVQSKAQYIFIYDVVQELLRQAFKPNHPGNTTHVRHENGDSSFTDAGSNASGPAKEDAVYDDVESLQGQITSSEEMLIRISTGSSDV
ncbi:receptor-type tyrosine-protein phosphatase eta-like [Physella acuta]|uniref:receptor-type tyrosine-protein phosphatase eta-like n=1 Tax=Physella acuta TaxID=109671 RepID=UPI0027DE9983|nr:receptor-type tyrosine-protein phosphatase eta-like [Physella acuta]